VLEGSTYEIFQLPSATPIGGWRLTEYPYLGIKSKKKSREKQVIN